MCEPRTQADCVAQLYILPLNKILTWCVTLPELVGHPRERRLELPRARVHLVELAPQPLVLGVELRRVLRVRREGAARAAQRGVDFREAARRVGGAVGGRSARRAWRACSRRGARFGVCPAAPSRVAGWGPPSCFSERRPWRTRRRPWLARTRLLPPRHRWPRRRRTARTLHTEAPST